MTHNFVINTDCFASQIRESQHNTTHTLRGRKPLALSIHWRIILFMLFSSMMFSPFESNGQTDTLICDNGGFESGFQYYFGYFATIDHGANTCTPLNTINQPVTWNSVALPTFRKFAIVSSGIDTLIGINRTKFGSNALLINNRYGHLNPICNGHWDANKLVKRFKVTEENRDFTIWYAAVLENPSGHSDDQPFFSIKCDIAPESDLCFDASNISCEENYNDANCTFTDIDAVDWSCHRIKIPRNMVDSIATIEIIGSDCACGLHFGYAYVDGICEECTGSALGSIKLYDNIFDETGLGVKYKSCEGNIITVCGNYTSPTVCGTWDVDSIKAPGFTISNMEIDEEHETFCFDLQIEDFPEDSCRELYVIIYFSSNLSNFSDQLSNTIEICDDEFEEYGIDVNIGECNDNNTTDLLSDDYYFVTIDMAVNCNDSFTMTRQLDDPYPNESGFYTIKTGIGSGTYNLGPLLIQEGSWELVINIEGCLDTFEIEPPFFCSGCNKFSRVKISNIICINGGSDNDPSNDTWTFDINVSGDPMDYYLINGGTPHYAYGTNYTFPVPAAAIGHTCAQITLSQDGVPSCFSYIYVCPPKPCSNDEDCELEFYVTDVYCDNHNMDFYVELDLSSGSSYTCYKATKVSNGSSAGFGSYSSIIGPFDEDIWLEIKICPAPICTCATPECFKVIYVPFPDCENLESRYKGSNNSEIQSVTELIVVPNPINGNEMILVSTLKQTKFELYNASGTLLHHASFSGPEYKFSLAIPAGLYYVKYKNSMGKFRFVKLIKL